MNIINIFTLIILVVIPKGSLQYKTLTVEDSELCSLIKSRKIKLGRGPKSGLIVKQNRLNDHSIAWEKNFWCTFKIETSKYNHKEDGVFAVIQYIVFRKNETTGECIDYVQFRGHDGATSRQFCGRSNYALSMDHNFVEPLLSSAVSASNAFVDSKGELSVDIFVSKEPLRVDEEMDLTIVFTAYRYCFLSLREDDYKPCGINHGEVCIYQEYFNDDYVNCPYPDCVDENGCEPKENTYKTKESVGNRVLIGSVSLLFVAFVIFICCLWVCRKHKVFCWSEEFAHPSTATQQSSRVIEMSEQTGSRLSQMPQNAPLPNVPPLEDDKPPSYDTLFPDR